MQICDECFALAGKDCTTEPHKSLRASGAGISGAFGLGGVNNVKLHRRWTCSDCGTWMYQCTEHDMDSPNRWRHGKRPSDWPQGLPSN